MAKGNPHLGLVPLKHIPFGLERWHRRLHGDGSGISCGRINTGVWQWRTKSGVTVKTKWELVWYILVRNLSTGSMVMSGRHLSNLGPRSFAWYLFRMVPGMDDCGFQINGPVSQLGASRSVDRVRTMGRTGLGSHNQGNANRQSNVVAASGMGPKRLPQLSRSDHD